jgi:hypothetical protein
MIRERSFESITKNTSKYLLPPLTYPNDTTTRHDTMHYQALSAGEGIDLPHMQMELSALLLTMLGWRWLNVAVFKRFTD